MEVWIMKKLCLLLAFCLSASFILGCSASDKEATGSAPAAREPAVSDTGAAAADTEEMITGNGPATGDADLIVFAAASLTETLTSIAKDYKSVAPDVSIVFNFDSSGTLKSQIENGAPCDLFISAAPKQMNQLDASKNPDDNPDGLDFVLQGTRLDLLENKVVLAVPDGNPASVTSFDVLADLLARNSVLLAMGNPDVPVGQYTQKILAYYGLDEKQLADEGLISYGSNVKEVTSQVSENAVDCGIIYSTDAYSAGLTVAGTATAEMCGRVVYPAAVMNTTKNETAARAFLKYLTEAEASAVFENVGFTTLS
jgi:molybdate transport system substrate-binding protein